MRNRLSNFKQISSLRYLKKLERLVLLHNPVTHVSPLTEKRDYRLFVVAMLPSLRILDFQKVTNKERVEAKEQFGGSFDKGLVKELEEMKIHDKVKLALEKARTVEEVNQIELLLKTSKISEELLDKMIYQLNF